jgi:hypothetical protein
VRVQVTASNMWLLYVDTAISAHHGRTCCVWFSHTSMHHAPHPCARSPNTCACEGMWCVIDWGGPPLSYDLLRMFFSQPNASGILSLGAPATVAHAVRVCRGMWCPMDWGGTRSLENTSDALIDVL